jgi:hypothetical protein
MKIKEIANADKTEGQSRKAIARAYLGKTVGRLAESIGGGTGGQGSDWIAAAKPPAPFQGA